MAEQNTEAKLKNLLKQEKIQLWNPPYTDAENQPGQQHIQVGQKTRSSSHTGVYINTNVRRCEPVVLELTESVSAHFSDFRSWRCATPLWCACRRQR